MRGSTTLHLAGIGWAAVRERKSDGLSWAPRSCTSVFRPALGDGGLQDGQFSFFGQRRIHTTTMLSPYQLPGRGELVPLGVPYFTPFCSSIWIRGAFIGFGPNARSIPGKTNRWLGPRTVKLSQKTIFGPVLRKELCPIDDPVKKKVQIISLYVRKMQQRIRNPSVAIVEMIEIWLGEARALSHSRRRVLQPAPRASFRICSAVAAPGISAELPFLVGKLAERALAIAGFGAGVSAFPSAYYTCACPCTCTCIQGH